VNVTAGKIFGRKHMEQSGQGAAYVEFDGGVKVLALTVVNAMGAIHDRTGAVVLGNRDPESGQRSPIVERLLKDNGAKSVEPLRGNTTISILVTNLKLDRLELARLARSTHTAMGRVIEPFQTQDDGDTLFAVSTRSLELTGDKKPEMSVLAAIAGRAMQDAVLSIPSAINPPSATTEKKLR
jgi:L-aminopeptidase/D-esterase-like protein